MIGPHLPPTQRPRRARAAMRLGATVLASCMAVAAAAQNSAAPPAPPPAGLDDFRIQRDGTIARPGSVPPTPVPAPAPAPAPPVTVVPAPVSPAPVVIAPAPVVPVPAPIAAPGPSVRSPAPAIRTTPRPPTATRPPPPAATPSATPPAAGEPEPTIDAPPPQPEPIVQPGMRPSATQVVNGPVAVPDAAQPAVAAAAADGFGGLAWLGLGLAGAIAGALAWRARRRRSKPDATPRDADLRIADEAPEPERPLALPTNVAKPRVMAPPASRSTIPARPTTPTVARPRLDLQFKPSTASATDARATVEYLLNIVNAGDAPARRVRMEARLFAMGPDHDAALAAFFEGALERPLSLASTIPAGIGFDQRSQVAMPRDAVQPIHVADRQLFVPLVAFKLTYEWTEGEVVHKEEVTASYVVGREAKPPAAKMAAFRLDQGPRIYREVGQRQHQLKKSA